jgi:class 3 adenylate cyclase
VSQRIQLVFLVTNRVHAAVDDRVEARPLGDIDFKGISRPVPTFEINRLT